MTYTTWFQELEPHSETQDKLILEASNQFAAIWVEDNYLGLIKQTFEKVTGKSVLISVRSLSPFSSNPLPNRVLHSAAEPDNSVGASDREVGIRHSVAQARCLLVHPLETSIPRHSSLSLSDQATSLLMRQAWQ